MNNEIDFDPFVNSRPICNCQKFQPKQIERITPTDCTDECETYICRWCKFIRDFGMTAYLENIEKEIFKDFAKKSSNDKDMYSDDECITMEDLENWGAFSDEGIMEGCHSSFSIDAEMGENFSRDYEEYERMRRFFGKTTTLAREYLNLSVKELAEYLKIPEYIIENLEAGEESIKYRQQKSSGIVHSIAVAVPVTTARKERDREWWEDKQDTEIEEKIQEFLIEYKNKKDNTNFVKTEVIPGPISNRKIMMFSPIDKIAKMLDFEFPSLVADLYKAVKDENTEDLIEAFWTVAKKGNIEILMLFFDYRLYINFFLQYPIITGKKLDKKMNFSQILKEYRQIGISGNVAHILDDEDYGFICCETLPEELENIDDTIANYEAECAN